MEILQTVISVIGKFAGQEQQDDIPDGQYIYGWAGDSNPSTELIYSTVTLDLMGTITDYYSNPQTPIFVGR